MVQQMISILDYTSDHFVDFQFMRRVFLVVLVVGRLIVINLSLYQCWRGDLTRKVKGLGRGLEIILGRF